MNAALRFLVFVLLTMLTACALATDSPIVPNPSTDIPPAIVPGRDTTYPDGRALDDPRFAATLITTSGEVRLFDDIGRMIVQRVASDHDIAASWVSDYETEAWLPAEEAYYVAVANLVTPRGSGLRAVRSREHADQLARELSGEVLTWTAVPTYLAAGPADPLPQSSGGLELGGLLEADGK